MNDGKLYTLKFKHGFKDDESNKNFADRQHVEMMNALKIKTKKPHTAFNQPHANDDSFVNKTNDDMNTIDIFCNLKYQEKLFKNKTRDRLNWFAQPIKTPNNEHVFGICLTERDRQHLIKEFPKTALNTASIQIPNIIKTSITNAYAKNKNPDENNNIMWIGG